MEIPSREIPGENTNENVGKKYLYYPGCSVKGMSKDYETSALAVMKALGVKLVEIEDWNCCGATAYITVNEMHSLVLSARNLAIAEQEGGEDIITVCPACYIVVNKTNISMNQYPQLKKKIQDALASAGIHKYSGSVKVRHILDVLSDDIGEEALRACVKTPLTGLKVAVYYGCQVTRPYATFDDSEHPVKGDRLFSMLGADVINYPLNAKCCGSMVMTTDIDASIGLTKDLIQCAIDKGADCIVTMCPLCQANLELFQDNINKKYDTHYSFPVIYFSKLMGIALGLRPKELDFGTEIVSAKEIYSRFIKDE
jgi:heterodisulfide reductase subunit B